MLYTFDFDIDRRTFLELLERTYKTTKKQKDTWQPYPLVPDIDRSPTLLKYPM